ncbi:MAG: SnoaL-like domain protein [Proteobacteria bacterium]|jgi:SnoaL-like domain|nr:SnoaL-like domain protein [Pseudomonadota bacterium]
MEIPIVMPRPIEQWHQVVKSRDTAALKDLLAEDVVFVSPVVHTPQVGRPITMAYLHAAMQVLNNDSFHYLNQWFGPESAVLEFECVVEGITVNGIDMIHWNAADRIDHFKVMVRPLKAVNKLHEMMGRELQRGSAQQ